MSVIDLKTLTLKARDGNNNVLDMKIGEGTLSFAEKKPRTYTRDRGKLDTVRNGDEEPIDVRLELTWEFLKGDGTYSIEELIKGEQSGATSVDSDACKPYACNLEIAGDNTCPDALVVTCNGETRTLNFDQVTNSWYDVKGINGWMIYFAGSVFNFAGIVTGSSAWTGHTGSVFAHGNMGADGTSSDVGSWGVYTSDGVYHAVSGESTSFFSTSTITAPSLRHLVLSYFRYEEMNHDAKAGTISVTGKCNVSDINAYNSAYPPGSSGSNAMPDSNYDTSAPVLYSAVVPTSGLSVALTFTDIFGATAPMIPSSPAVGSFTVTQGSTSHTISAAGRRSGQNFIFDLTLSSAITAAGGTVVVTYTPGSLSDSVGNLVSFFTVNATNNSTV